MNDLLAALLAILRDTVNGYLTASAGWGGALSTANPAPDPCVFPDGGVAGDALSLKVGAITLFLVNLEEDHTLRPADPYRRTLRDGTFQQVSPAIPINAYVLFAARFQDYNQSLRAISLVLQLFQGRRVLDHDNTPALSDRIEKLILELKTLPFSEQNHLWSLLRCSYQPSLLYRVRMLVFEEEAGVAPPVLVDPSVKKLAALP